MSLGLLAVEQFFERAVFLFIGVHVTPMPEFDYDSSKWESMAYVLPDPPSREMPDGVGLVFNDAAYGRKFFDLLRAWNFGSNEDRDQNLCLSFITDEDLYFVFLYPNPDRPSVMESLEDLKRERGDQSRENREPFLIVISLTFCKSFSTLSGYGLGRFLDRRRPGNPFLLMALYSSGGATPHPIEGVEPIKKYHLKAKTRIELTKDDFEFEHWKRIIRR